MATVTLLPDFDDSDIWKTVPFRSVYLYDSQLDLFFKAECTVLQPSWKLYTLRNWCLYTLFGSSFNQHCTSRIIARKYLC